MTLQKWFVYFRFIWDCFVYSSDISYSIFSHLSQIIKLRVNNQNNQKYLFYIWNELCFNIRFKKQVKYEESKASELHCKPKSIYIPLFSKSKIFGNKFWVILNTASLSIILIYNQTKNKWCMALCLGKFLVYK